MAEIKKIAEIKCPVCGGVLELHAREDYSFWPEGILELMMHCRGCGYRSVDIMPLRSYEPRILELKVEYKDDLNIRVVKSSSATIKIPEIGIEIKPGPASQGYISNVEGILDRIESILTSMVMWKKPNAKKMLERLRSIRENLSEPFTLVIEDPNGCSLIISDKTKTKKFN